jgi:hypothetical protein
VVFEVPSRINPLKWNSPGRRCALEGLISEVILKQFYSVLVFCTFRHSRPTGFPIFIGTGYCQRQTTKIQYARQGETVDFKEQSFKKGLNG